MRSDIAFLEVMVVSSSLFYIRSIDVRRGLFKKADKAAPMG
jgi:hypothetical protein